MAIKLSDIRAAADKKFGPTVFDLEDGKEPVELVNPLRLDKKVRDRLANLKESISEEGADEDEVISGLLIDAAKTPAGGKRLVAAAGGDKGVLLTYFEMWIEGTDLGEASPSES
ncbi:phage tail assembly protein [Puerhibacterium puerhi]|uniref:phage tail assembly protein n=1 Tax=Puerhibacterium puerhi TaxID=2692623 RepID=UPI001915E572|nr:phage tail assembly protein [Puerhibacterium puerhi]